MKFLGFLEYLFITAAFWAVSLDPHLSKHELLALIFFVLWAIGTLITIAVEFFKKKEAEPDLNIYNSNREPVPAFHPVGRDARGRFISQVKQHDLEQSLRGKCVASQFPGDEVIEFKNPGVDPDELGLHSAFIVRPKDGVQKSQRCF